MTSIGICSWIPTETNKISKIYYSTQKYKWEYGFGQDLPDNEGFLYNVNSKDSTLQTQEVSVLGQQPFQEDSDLSQLKKWSTCVGFQYEYSGALAGTMQFKLFNADELTKDPDWYRGFTTTKSIQLIQRK